jgi:XTP/dITP diphosphohydrolase
MNIILATRNPSKAHQIQALFEGSSITVLTLDDVGVEGDAIEDGNTLQENAQKKVEFTRKQLKEPSWIMADDTGLFIDALDGRPGIKAARWAGETATTDEITEFTLKHLEGAADRSATFETVVAVMDPDGNEYFFSGKCPGKILETPRTKPQPKMPYSAIFQPDASSLTWAEMPVDEENKISHRGLAFSQVREFLEKQTA